MHWKERALIRERLMHDSFRKTGYHSVRNIPPLFDDEDLAKMREYENATGKQVIFNRNWDERLEIYKEIFGEERAAYLRLFVLE